MDVRGAQVVLVVGAATTVGRSITEALADEGAQLFLTDVVDGHLDDVVERVARRTGRRPERQVLRVTDPDAWGVAVAAVEARFGRLDLVVNAAEWDPGVRWRDAGADQWARAVDINLMGAVHGFTAAVPALRASRGRFLVVACDRPDGVVGASARSAAITFAQAVGGELAPQVTVVTAVVRDGADGSVGSRIVAAMREGVMRITVDSPEGNLSYS